jgi:hypothetical protein
MGPPQTDAVGGDCSAGNVMRTTVARYGGDSSAVGSFLSTDFVTWNESIWKMVINNWFFVLHHLPRNCRVGKQF